MPSGLGAFIQSRFPLTKCHGRRCSPAAAVPFSARNGRPAIGRQLRVGPFNLVAFATGWCGLWTFRSPRIAALVGYNCPGNAYLGSKFPKTNMLRPMGRYGESWPTTSMSAIGCSAGKTKVPQPVIPMTLDWNSPWSFDVACGAEFIRSTISH